MSSRTPLSSLSPTPTPTPISPVSGNYRLSGIGNLILWFIIIAVIVWIILWIWKSPVVQVTGPNGQPTGVPDGGKTLLGAIIIALIIVIIIWLIQACR